jgi:hypothetical protein
VPPFHGLEPHLRLTYDSNAGNGLLGVGWSLAGLSTVQRTTPVKGVPRYATGDVFRLDGAELVPCTTGMSS